MYMCVCMCVRVCVGVHGSQFRGFPYWTKVSIDNRETHNTTIVTIHVVLL